MNDLTIKQNNDLIKQMPKKYSKFKKLSSFNGDLFRNEKLIEIKIGNGVYVGKCFINTDKGEMYWRPMHQWYVFIDKLDAHISYDLLQDKLIKIIPTDVELNTFFEKKLKSIKKKGSYHLEETKKAYVELQELRSS